jgi:hypothetical protein
MKARDERGGQLQAKEEDSSKKRRKIAPGEGVGMEGRSLNTLCFLYWGKLKS